jgi:hypothetical protein
MAEFIEIATGEAVEVEVPLADAGARLFFRVLRREIGPDGGLSLELHGGAQDAAGETGELLRFDLFRDDPHFHIPATRTEPTGHIERESDVDHAQLVAKVVARAEVELAEWLRDAGQALLANELGAPPYSQVRNALQDAVAAAPEPVKRIRVELTPAIRLATGL